MADIFTNDVIVEPGTSPLSVTGSAISVTNFPATQPVSGTITVTQPTGTNLHTVIDSGTVTTTNVTSNSSTVTQITSTGANQTLLAANAARKGAYLFLASGNWSIKLGAIASATSFTFQSSSANTTIQIPTWVGQIDAICTTSGKLVNVTELS